MKNTSIIFVIVALLVLGGAIGYSFMKKTDSAMKKDTTDTMVKDEKMMAAETPPMVKADEAGMEKDDVMVGTSNEKMMQKEGKYIPFSSELLANSISTRRVLFFYANWCPTCKAADKNFLDNITKIPFDVTLIRVNYNDTETDQAEKDLAQKYGITYQHTFVQIDANGNPLAQWNGGQITELLSNLQ